MYVSKGVIFQLENLYNSYEVMMIIVNLLENINELSLVFLLFCSFFYYRHLKKLNRKRKLSSSEFSMFIMIQLAYVLWADSFALLFLDRNLS